MVKSSWPHAVQQVFFFFFGHFADVLEVKQAAAIVQIRSYSDLLLNTYCCLASNSEQEMKTSGVTPLVFLEHEA